MMPEAVVPDGKNVFNVSHTPSTPLHAYDTPHVPSYRIFLMKNSDDSFINGANPGGVWNRMEITALRVYMVWCDRQQPGSSKTASVCAVQELKIANIRSLMKCKVPTTQPLSSLLRSLSEIAKISVNQMYSNVSLSLLGPLSLITKSMRQLSPHSHEAEFRFPLPANPAT